jgi:hypothetical protein
MQLILAKLGKCALSTIFRALLGQASKARTFSKVTSARVHLRSQTNSPSSFPNVIMFLLLVVVFP